MIVRKIWKKRKYITHTLNFDFESLKLNKRKLTFFWRVAELIALNKIIILTVELEPIDRAGWCAPQNSPKYSTLFDVGPFCVIIVHFLFLVTTVINFVFYNINLCLPDITVYHTSSLILQLKQYFVYQHRWGFGSK